MIRESDIVYERGDYWVLKIKNGFEVYRNKGTHSIRCSQIGFTGNKGLNKAIVECDRRSLIQSK